MIRTFRTTGGAAARAGQGLITLVALMALPSVAAAQAWTVHEVPGWSINNHSQVAFHRRDTTTSAFWDHFAFVATQDEGVYWRDADGDGANDLEREASLGPDVRSTWISSIEDSGWVIGQARYDIGGSNLIWGYVAVPGGGYTLLLPPNPSGCSPSYRGEYYICFGARSEALDANAHGHIVGSYGSSSVEVPVLWTSSVATPLAGSTPGRAVAINDQGEIAGTLQINGEAHAVRWVGGQVEDLGTLGGPMSQAIGIDAQGRVAGNACFDATCSVPGPNQLQNARAFIWADGVMTEVGLGGNVSSAVAMNSKGEIVGWAYDATATKHYFLHLPAPAYGLAEGTHVLETLAEPDVSISEVRDINDLGQVVYRASLYHVLSPPGFVWPTAPPPAPLPELAPFEAEAGDPIATSSGTFSLTPPADLVLHGATPLSFARNYHSDLSPSQGAGLGTGWRHNWAWSLAIEADRAVVTTPSGALVSFVRDADGWLPAGRDVGFALIEDLTTGEHVLVEKNGATYRFQGTNLIEVTDVAGRVITLDHTPGVLVRIAAASGDGIDLVWDDRRTRIQSVSDGTRTVSFAYDEYALTLAGVTDVLGHTTEYTYDLLGRLLDSTSPRGNVPFVNVYGAGNRVVEQTDGAGHMLSLTYEANITVLERDGAVTQHVHDDGRALVAITLPSGAEYAYTYDDSGRRTSMTDAAGRVTTFTYDPETGRTREVTTPGGTTAMTWTARTTAAGTTYDLATITKPDGTELAFGHDADGNLTSFTNGAGETHTYMLDAEGRLTAHTRPDGTVTGYTWGDDGELAAILPPGATTPTTLSYDALGRLAAIAQPDGSARSYVYDDADHVVELIDERGAQTLFGYDANGHLASVTDATGATTTLTRDGLDRIVEVTDTLGHTSTVTWDTTGRVTAITTPDGSTQQRFYDADGHLVGFTDGSMASWTLQRDASGLLAARTDPLGQTTTYERDAVGRLVRTVTPTGAELATTWTLAGRIASTSNGLGAVTSFDYDAAGRLRTVTLPTGESTSIERDAAGRITAVVSPDGGRWTRTWGEDGLLVSSTDPDGRVTAYTHNERGWPAEVTLPDGMGSYAIEYDGAGAITAQRYSDGTTLELSYDAVGRIVGGTNLSLAHDATGQVIESNGLAISRDAAGRIASSEVAQGKSVTYSYDARGLVTEAVDWGGRRTRFEYDAAGRRTAIEHANGLRTELGYDADGRLVDIRNGDTHVALTRDAAGQIVTAQRALPLRPTAVAPQDVAPEHDALGRRTTDGLRDYTWDLAGRLAAWSSPADSASFEYDALGFVTRRNGGDVVWNYAFTLPAIASLSDETGQTTLFVHTPDGELLYALDAQGDARHYLFDEMGHTIARFDANGAVTDAYAYTPYGVLAAHTGESGNPFTYGGRDSVLTEDAGLYRMGRRLYDANSGRFLSREPVPDDPHPLVVDPHGFAAANPMLYRDPLGEAPQDQSKPGETVASALGTAKKVTTAADKVLSNNLEAGEKIVETLAAMDLPKDSVGAAIASSMGSEVGELNKKLVAVKSIGAGLGVAELAVKTYNEGWTAPAEELLTQGTTKVLGETAGSVVGAGIEIYKTKQKIDQTVTATKANHNSALDNYSTTLAELRRLYFKEKAISYEQYEAMFKAATAAFDESVAAATASGVAEIQQHAVEGGKSAIEKFVGF